MDAFRSYVARSTSIIAAHAMLRALADRRALGKRNDLIGYMNAICGTHDEAKSIAQHGIDIILDARGGSLSTLSDKDATAYIKWLSDFVVTRAARGHEVRSDRGRTLLFKLRKTIPTNQS
jgi:hypothetical protein